MTDIQAELAAIRRDLDRNILLIEELQRRMKEDRIAAEQETKWPKYGDRVWILWADGSVGETNYSSCVYKENDQGRVFKTRAAAEQKAENERTIKALADAADFTPDWKNGQQKKCYPWFDHIGGRIEFDNVQRYQRSSLPHFRTEAEGQAAVEVIGVDKIRALFTGGGGYEEKLF